ncbi:DNA repair ATPase [Carnobacterium divergens]|uniref:TrlF family AAA-like ATPase n=1 Tax=Carnobacterium divergens TaxID=2748 RepID=UPI001071D869|nr:DNA repair ATPase [Carnobacterium divergens]TFI60489.1 DNA repair ATPase [Carnobacterium divergens]TFI61566.1 DNA repair ATPase [Carnobacterium divergens]TFJ01409.1 DNA repair ATPase [Carnobacterium divergens]TFJ08411.1 DNA repair ATPase [Carnobacterium divergens]TFJ16298.1 DNA repair ATPase [Carnobacterium divergens]
MNENRGSQFRKWDLHLHSLYSHSQLCNQYKINENNHEESFDKFLKRLKENDIEAIGLTNYFNFSEQDFCLKKKLEENGIVVFLNLELRLENGNVKNETCDIHVIFDNLLDDSKIRCFLASMTAKVVNKRLDAISNESDYKKAVVNFDDLVNCLDDTSLNLRNRYMIGILGRGKGSSRLASIFEDIAERCDFFIHSSDNQKNIDEDKEYINSNGKPLLQSSDAHSYEKIGEKFSWIKADLSFEGLRQIIFDPADRISLGKDNPDTKLDYQVIDSIELSDTRKIYLNSSLNTVIGGRSTGKSTLTNSIAKAVRNEHFVPIDKNTQRGMHIFDKDISISWRDGQEHQDLEFLPQDYMIQIAENDIQRNSLVRSTVKSDEDNHSKIEKFEEDTRKNQNEIDNLIQGWSYLKDKLENITKPEGDKKGIETQLQKLKKQISEQEKKSDFPEKKSQEYKKSDGELKNHLNRQRLSKINLDNLNDMENIEITLSTPIPSSDDTNFRKYLEEYIEILNEEVNEKWKQKINELVEEQNEIYDVNKSKVDEILNSEIFKQGQENISNNETLRKLIEIQKQEQVKLDAFIKYEDSKESLESQISETQNNILSSYAKFGTLREKLQNDFEVKATPVEIKINFQPIKFEEKIKYLNGRSTTNNNFIEEFDKNSSIKIVEIFDDLNLSYNQGKNQNDLIKDVLSQHWFTVNYVLQYDGDNFEQMSQGKKAFVVLTLILEFSKDKKPVIIDQPEDSLDNRAIFNDLTNYLKQKKKERQIILVTHNPNIVVGADAENVIVANQHSEDSPNSEDIQFDYINGALENTYTENSAYTLEKQGIREHVVEILEGGKEAFEKREKKYK